MKGRIGKYKDKIVVWGDPNLTAKNEINIDSLGGGQSSIPVEYYKVVALEGEDLTAVREDISDSFRDSPLYIEVRVKGIIRDFSNSLVAGIPKLLASTTDEIYAYAATPSLFKFKHKSSSGETIEQPLFSNIFEALSSVNTDEAMVIIKQHLVPITAEEFYNLDDIE